MAGKKIVDGAVDAANEAAAKGADAAKGALGAVGGLIGKAKEAAGNAVEGVKDAAGNVVEGAADLAADAGKVVGDVVEGAKDAAGNVIEGAKDVAGNVVEGAADLAADAGKVAGKVVGDVVEGAKDAAGNVIEGAKDVAGNVVEGAADLAADAGKVVGDVVENTGEAIKDGVDKIGATGAAALGAGAAVVGGVAAAAGNLGKGVADTAAKGANVATGFVKETATDAAAYVGETKGKKGILVPLALIIGVGALGWYGLSKYSGNAKTGDTAAVSAPAATEIATPAWFTSLVDGLKTQFPWLSLSLSNNSIIATGEAESDNAKHAALANIAMAVELSEGKGASVIDNIKVKGSEEVPVGAALAGLGANPDVATCGKAFTDTMNGRTINFATGAATISADSAALLDALTGIANACKSHKIEVAGHTDARGNADANLKLSQERADAVKAFWVGKGVPAEGLKATGYGSTKPLDTATTDAAYAKNRRTEFTVSE